jgi:hypothetical protein
MAPSAYAAFFAASLGAAATLLGLLFVAVSIAPERTFAPDAPIERQIVADSAFTALVNAFFVSMTGAIPGFNIGIVATIIGTVSLLQTAYAGKRLWEGKATVRTLSQRLALVALGLLIYAFQVYYGVRLIRSPTDVTGLIGLLNPMFGVYGFALTRSWELLGGGRGIFAVRLRRARKAKPVELPPTEPARLPVGEIHD